MLSPKSLASLLSNALCCHASSAFILRLSRPNFSNSVSFSSTLVRLNSENNAHIITTSTSDDITETMRQESLKNYDKVRNHFSSRDNDIIFLPNYTESSRYIDANFDTILFDCDGVIYRGVDAIPDAAESVKGLIQAGKKILFVTNNAGSNRMQLRDKLAKLLDLEDELIEEQMVAASYSAAKYVEKALGQAGIDMADTNLHVIGTGGLCDELRSFGCRVTGGPSSDHDDNYIPSMSRDELASYTFDHETNFGKVKVNAVVVGLDNDFSYRKLCICTVLLQMYPDALLVATNEDAYDLVGSDARHLPGNELLVKAIEHSSQRDAINVGKPSKILAELLSEEHGFDPSRTLMVGDRLDTDVRFGKDSGMKSALVLTGCTTVEKLIEVNGGTEDEPLPDIIFPHCGLMGIHK